MDIKRRKELLSAYKNRHPEMGVISFHCRTTGEAFLTIASDTTARLNRVHFQLSAGQCPNKRLQELWTRYGEEVEGNFKLRNNLCRGHERLQRLMGFF